MSKFLESYEKISRWGLKSAKSSLFENKKSISDKIRINSSDSVVDKDNKLKLLTLLIQFKFYREDKLKKSQEFMLEAINKLLSEPTFSKLDLSLTKIMAFVKNDGILVQRKITGHLKDLLVNLNSDEQQKIADNIKTSGKDFNVPKDEEEKYCKQFADFLHRSVGIKLNNYTNKEKKISKPLPAS